MLPTTAPGTAALGRVADRPAPLLHLMAGELYFGRRVGEVRTLLGSCVGVTLWHAGRRLGGMCHFLLPSRRRPAGQPLDARFGTEAFELLLQALRDAGTAPSDYEVQLYGGADTLPSRTDDIFNIGQRNIELGWTLIDRHGFRLVSVDVGDQVPRSLSISMTDGRVRLRRGRMHGEKAAA